ncbi:MAG: hypothetical protein C0467_24205 [Planctomycetaceae bacterium]|nr:hypothetical protein [Planctomycetaceae bacterium]
MIPKTVGWNAEDAAKITELANALRRTKRDCGNLGDPVIRPGVIIMQSDSPLEENIVRFIAASFPRKEGNRVPTKDLGNWVLQLPHEDSWTDAFGPIFDIDAAQLAGRYVEHFLALEVSPDAVEEYLKWERRTLASLYFMICESHPSPMALRSLADRYDSDARKEVGLDNTPNEPQIVAASSQTPDLTPATAQPSSTLPQYGSHRIGTELSTSILAQITGPSPNFYALRGLIEKVLGHAPLETETLEYYTRSRLSFSIEGDLLILRIDGQVVRGVANEPAQALLQYLCLHPDTRISGRGLQKKLGKKLTNASTTATKVRAAMKRVLPAAGEWLEKNPLRWASGVKPVKHAVTRQDPPPDKD